MIKKTEPSRIKFI